MSEPYHVLLLRTGNPARSILAEAILNGEGRGKFKAIAPRAGMSSRRRAPKVGRTCNQSAA